MYLFYALSTLFLQPILTVPITVLAQSDVRIESPVSLLNTTNTFSNGLTGPKSLSSPTFLTFNLFGSQIPSSVVDAAFNGAITRIYRFLQNQPDDPISNDNFQYRAVGGSVQIGVTGFQHHQVSWQQLNSLLRQASHFMNGDLGAGRQHMQELSFEVFTDGTKMGDGLVSYHASRGLRPENPVLANLTSSNHSGLLLPATDPSLNSPTANDIPFRIPGTPFTLIFGYLGNAIPISSVWAAFEGAYSEIAGPLAQHPADSIPGDRFKYDEEGIHITVLANRGIIITWKQLSWILNGLYAFMIGIPEHYQLLMCDIVFAGHGNVGFAAVWFYPPSPEVTKRALLNTTISLPVVPNTLESFPFPVPNTPMIITFKCRGTLIPERELDDAIWAALNQIIPLYREHGPDTVPGNHFFRAQKGIRITIFANVPHVMSWTRLYNIVWGLLLFVTGADRGNEHHRILSFDVDDVRTGRLAYGTLRYSAPVMVDI